MLNAAAFITIPYVRQTRYTFDSFAYVANLVSDPASINVHPDSEFKTIQDLVTFAKVNPGRVTIGMQGVGSAMHLATLAFARAVGSREAVPFVKEGQVRNLGMMGTERWAELPEARTMIEQGIDVVAGSDRGMAAPAGTPNEILERLATTVRQSVEDPEFTAKAWEQLLVLNYMPRADYRALLTRTNDEIGQLWRTDPWRK